AKSLGTAAVMSQLRRLAIGPFQIEDAIDLNDLATDSIIDRLLPSVTALAGMPHVVVSPAGVFRLAQGQAIDAKADVVAVEVSAVTSSGELVAILTPKNGQLAPLKCFTSGLAPDS